MTRRAALVAVLQIGAAALLVRPRHVHAYAPMPHPEPRPGITAERVLADSALPERKRTRAAYEAARRSPQIFDGLYCACDCRDSMDHRSLLSCFESTQATGCHSCQEQAELVAKLVSENKTLSEIRAAFDKRWG